jgi:ribosomal protein S18 acetylase RimI-like enzyme
MTVRVREMVTDDTNHVVEMVRGLARYVGTVAIPGLTAESLNGHRDLIDVVVAEEDGRIVGACLTLMTFSTWRGAKGLYVVDLFVKPEARGHKTGLRLLKLAAARGMALGASFIKLEVDYTNVRAQGFYERLGFVRKDQDRLFVLEREKLELLVD